MSGCYQRELAPRALAATLELFGYFAELFCQFE
jgi:hypothetical protein